ncbi:penicillin-binding protein activator [Enterobacteriaceae bacterium H20N1]|uniref:Penicillin-binding protein activator LpoA n=1 Tax=Dryocola boscaweniae TaxID=2925397 RepID=A0A9X2WAG1_9ENTR|nr:penicillin-binding protein activator [Dryocola boscaweniae]MCT4703108.1 penicillin-binding protein activator [Dryocola boscaweniae]MCT4720276.1 penicillin-binding protein activator [Dryocola boscaweniae]
MLPSKFIRSKAGRCLPVVLAALVFAGCTTKAPDRSAAHIQGEVTADSAYYLQQMQQSADDSKTAWQLLAIHALLGEGKTQQAVELYNQLPQEMNNDRRLEKTLLAPEIKVALKDYAGANALLTGLDPSAFNKKQQARYYQAVIDASQNRPSLALLRAYIAQEPMLKGTTHQKNIDGTWQALTQLTPEQMNTMVINADENTLQGWLDLQRVWNDNRNDPNMLKAGIKDWQTRYPQNPGAKTLPTQLSNMQNYQQASVGKIALLLPLNGQAAVFGRAIQQGFEAAKNNGSAPVAAVSPSAQMPDTSAQPAAEQTTTDANAVAIPSDASVSDLTNEQAATQSAPQPAQPAVQSAASAPANPSAEVKIYDTSSQPLDQLLAQAQQDGATLVVGPLLKNNVDRLANSTTSLNILALNQPENVQNRPNICYFALSPEDEARDAANHIWQEGHRAPLLLVPRSALGDRVTSAFSAEWQKLGGGIVLQQKFGSVGELKQGINSGSGIALTGTPVTSSAPQQEAVTIGGLTIPAPPTDAQITAGSSEGVDAAYIVATPDEVALIKPMIAMRTGSRSNVQLYASSRSSQGVNGPDFRLEMEGLQFSEIPMLSGGNSSLQQQALSAVRNDYSLARLYAMGIDAWSLANHFSQIRQVPGYQVNGNTGTLSANQDCVINRKLNWLKFSQGQIIPAG